jgi:hypothetical protein
MSPRKFCQRNRISLELLARTALIIHVRTTTDLAPDVSFFSLYARIRGYTQRTDLDNLIAAAQKQLTPAEGTNGFLRLVQSAA